MHFQALAGRMIETAHEFMALTWKVLPFFLIGAIAGAALQAAMFRKGSERTLGGRGIRPLLAEASAAALSALLPEEAIPGFLGGSSGFWAYVLAALVGIPLYVCEGEEVPITYALVARGLGPGPSLTFLLGSVGTCVPTMLMARNIIGRRATVVYAVFWFMFVIGSGGLFQLLGR